MLGEIELTIVFPGLSCDMLLVVANIGSDGLLGMEALQLCLPHQLDLRTGQLWAEGRSTLQLHQQRLATGVNAFLKTSVVRRPDSEIVAPVSVRSPSDIRPDSCSLVEPAGRLTEDYGVVVGSTLVDASSRSAGVLMVNPNAEEIVLPSFTFVGKLVPVSAVSVALMDLALPETTSETLPDHLEDIVAGSHKEMLVGGQIESSDSPWASPVVLVTKKDGSTRFCVDYHWLNSLMVKDAYPLPHIDDSLRLLGNQQWFSTMDLAS